MKTKTRVQVAAVLLAVAPITYAQEHYYDPAYDEASLVVQIERNNIMRQQLQFERMEESNKRSDRLLETSRKLLEDAGNPDVRPYFEMGPDGMYQRTER